VAFFDWIGAGGPLEEERAHDWGVYNVTQLKHHFVLLEIKPCAISWVCYGLSGRVLDSFSWPIC
jgi:hypothetical protein